MNRKFSIIATLDLDKIDDEIEKYVNQVGGSFNPFFEPYIFMNADTARAIASQVGADIKTSKAIKSNAGSTYKGYKVFIDDDLRFGTIELR